MDTNLKIDNEQVVKQLCKRFKVNYNQFGFVWRDKMVWQRMLWNEADRLGFANRVCRDVTNMILSEPVRMWTPSDQINMLIEEEVKTKLNFDEIFAKHLDHCMGIGDMVMSVYMDNLDNAPAINYIPGYNVIPIKFNNHRVTELIWFSTTRLDDLTYVIATFEGLDRREIMLFEYASPALIMISHGSPIWARILGQVKPVYKYDEEVVTPKFAWVSTGLSNKMWIDTPFHNSFIWPVEYIKSLNKSWELLQQEYSNSVKRIFVSPDVVKRTYDVTDSNGMPIPIKKFNPKDTLFECVDLTEDKIKEWNPQIRFTEFTTKMKFDLQQWGLAVGLGAEMYDLDRQGRVEMTATQVLLSHREAFNTINNIKNNLKTALRTILFAMIQYWFAMGMIDPAEMELVNSPSKISIHFDDGVFVNKEAKMTQGMNLYDRTTPDGSHLISRQELLHKYCDYTEEEARMSAELAEQEMIQGLQLQMALAAAQGGAEEGQEGEQENE